MTEYNPKLREFAWLLTLDGRLIVTLEKDGGKAVQVLDAAQKATLRRALSDASEREKPLKSGFVHPQFYKQTCEKHEQRITDLETKLAAALEAGPQEYHQALITIGVLESKLTLEQKRTAALELQVKELQSQLENKKSAENSALKEREPSC